MTAADSPIRTGSVTRSNAIMQRLQGEVGRSGNAPDARIEHWLLQANVDLFACSHTCLSFILDFSRHHERVVVVNNGAAGLPIFIRNNKACLAT